MHVTDITVREVTERKDKLIAELTAPWEASVRATHTFLMPEGIAEIRGFVPAGFPGRGAFGCRRTQGPRARVCRG